MTYLLSGRLSVDYIQPCYSRSKFTVAPVGRLSIFSNIESDLIFLFGVLIGADLYTQAVAVFADVNNFALKLKMVDLLVEKECSEKEKAIWHPISGTISTHKGIRNLIAHQRMSFESIEGPMSAMSRVVLEPTPFGSTKKGRKRERHQIQATADALEPIADRVYQFARDLMLRRAPNSLRAGGTGS
ncbi:hypothetical protein [Bradyrhizobium sp. sBnM-33]|uniref:hypothetical protein n=1 Tax=Bradyrhizobium sp. sBnM-33 TaxID=2831780 RepID=UPI001BD089BA|nr:hypothetical protein [Bradyrhizobium sp. sBnM-33]WOH53519.1 hypothetical protein RX328_16360 [Bradyrhizobium sp. sBnM-33]